MTNYLELLLRHAAVLNDTFDHGSPSVSHEITAFGANQAAATTHSVSTHSSSFTDTGATITRTASGLRYRNTAALHDDGGTAAAVVPVVSVSDAHATPRVAARVGATPLHQLAVAPPTVVTHAEQQLTASLRRAMWQDSGTARVSRQLSDIGATRFAASPDFATRTYTPNGGDIPSIGDLSRAIERDARRYG